MRTAEESRDAERLKLEMVTNPYPNPNPDPSPSPSPSPNPDPNQERRHTEHLRREALLQTSRDEISSAAQEAQRDAVLALARVRHSK